MDAQNEVRVFVFDQAGLDKWMHQNRATYTGNIVEGSLLDNFVLACKRGFAAVYEKYLNEWSSIYRVEFQVDAAQDVWRRWYEFEERNKEYAV